MSAKYPGNFITENAPAGFSVVLNTQSDYLTLASNTAFAMGTGAYTIEAWVYCTAFSTNGGIIFAAASTTDALNVGMGSNGNFNLSKYGAGGVVQTSTTFSLNNWYHVAVVRDSTSANATRIYVNGVLQVTGTDSNNWTVSSAPVIGRFTSLSNYNFVGYISNLRVVKGTALYTSAFTPPTQLFPVTNTSLLACQSPTIIDNSSNAFAITINGSAAVSNFTPFAAYTGFNPALGAAAPGVWTISQAEYYQATRQWPIYDPYFKNTTLLLHGNGTNGAQNNTFLDSSTNNFTITRNGNTTQGTFTPFSQTGWGVYNTSSSYCQLNNADYAISTGDFTIEFWMYCTDDSGSRAFAGLPGAGVLTISMTSGSSGARQPYMEFGGAGTLFTAFSGYLNRWTHVAFVRSSGTVTVYQNGIALSSASKAAAFPNSANLYLARLPTDTTQDFIGYLSNYRITKAAVYTSNFTPSTAPLAPIANTVLMTFQDNRYKDNSANNSTVTPSGSNAVQAFSPFVPAYITPTTYSAWFNNSSSSYLTVPNNAVFALPGDFTVEGWFNFNQQASSNQIMSLGSEASAQNGFSIYNPTGTEVRFYSNGAAVVTTSGAALATNTWYHIAVVRSGSGSNNLVIYVNGVSKGTATNTTSFTGLAGNGVCIGTSYSGTYGGAFGGAMSNVRIVKGTAVYTSAFTPPTAPLTAISGTSLLTCQSNTFIDNSSNAFTITSAGNVQPVTSPTPFAPNVDTTTLNSAYSTTLVGGSGYFDGSGDYLSMASGSSIGTGAFCLEAWVYLTSTLSNQTIFGADGTNNRISIKINSATQVSVDQYGVIADNFTVATMSLNTWNHIVVTRNASSTLTVFVNGVRSSTGAISNSRNYTTVNAIGRFDGTSGYYLTGYISGARETIGSTPYDPNQTGFAVPTTPPTAITNTALLCNYTNAGILDSTAKNVLETVGNAQISTTQSKWGGSSMYFDGTGDWLKFQTTASANYNFTFGSADFTIECWVYPSNTSTVCLMQGQTDNSTIAGGSFLIRLNGNADFYSGGTAYNCTSASPTANQWSHVAYVRNGTSLKVYLNGTQVGSTTLPATTTAMNTGSTNYPLTIGSYVDGTGAYTGYIDDLRITKGYARYTTNFTPPTSQLQDQ